MLLLIVLFMMQSSLNYGLLQIEDSRADDVSALVEALGHSDAAIQLQAVRALGRFERPEYQEAVRALLDAEDAAVRREAINALGQMSVPLDFVALLEEERDSSVRAVIYGTMGRLPGADERVLVEGLGEGDPIVQAGAARGIEAHFRLDGRDSRPAEPTLIALRRTIQESGSSLVRKMALQALTAADDDDPETLAKALADEDAQVRRLAVLASKQWRDDPSYIVRYEALRLDPDCERARAALDDESEHVALLAVDQLGELGCATGIIASVTDRGKTWRMRSRALLALARVDVNGALERLYRFMGDGRWQVRAYAARAAKLLGDDGALNILVRDRHPNVVAAALRHYSDAVGALESRDYGVIIEAASLMDDASEVGPGPALLEALLRITAEGRATSRDPRSRLLRRLREYGDPSMAARIEPLLQDFDPVIAKLAAEIVSEWTGRVVSPSNVRYEPMALPDETFIGALAGATAVVNIVNMEREGAFTLELMTDEATATVATFASLAEGGFYNGLTFHRVVPNFVIQGGSSGANEYVGDGPFMRDEVGLASHLRGTVGISTRGRDTGDAQIFINLVDNFRLDHSYTVFARVVEGMDVVDRIQEGSIIDSIEIVRWTFQ